MFSSPSCESRGSGWPSVALLASNPAGGRILLMTVRRFFKQTVSLSGFISPYDLNNVERDERHSYVNILLAKN